MIDQLCIGKRYRLQLSGAAVSGYLEGVLRSTRLPRGTLGNSDGEHRIWISGEEFEWFLRPGDIQAIHELEDAPAEAPVPILPRDLCEHGSSWLRHRRQAVPGHGTMDGVLWCTNRLRRED